MKLFRRKQDVVTDIPELEQYYAQRRSGSGLGWLLALVTLAITAIVAIALFYAGRWIYNQINEAPETNQPATVQNDQQQGQQPTFDGEINQPAPTDGQGAPAEDQTGQDTPGDSPAPNTDSPSVPAPDTVPRTGDSPPPLPRTGDGPDL